MFSSKQQLPLKKSRSVQTLLTDFFPVNKSSNNDSMLQTPTKDPNHSTKDFQLLDFPRCPNPKLEPIVLPPVKTSPKNLEKAKKSPVLNNSSNLQLNLKSSISMNSFKDSTSRIVESTTTTTTTQTTQTTHKISLSPSAKSIDMNNSVDSLESFFPPFMDKPSTISQFSSNKSSDLTKSNNHHPSTTSLTISPTSSPIHQENRQSKLVSQSSQSSQSTQSTITSQFSFNSNENSNISLQHQVSRSKRSFSLLENGSSKKKISKNQQQKSDLYRFIDPQYIRDAQQRRPDHPDYDSNTLYISPSQLNALTNFERQYWSIKKQHYNTVLFFQKGYFYELYSKDAFIGKEKLDLKITQRVGMPMVGVPLSAFAMWSSKLLGLGHTVARVAEQKKMDKSKSKHKSSTIVERKLVEFLTPSTITDPDCVDNQLGEYLVSFYIHSNSDDVKNPTSQHDPNSIQNGFITSLCAIDSCSNTCEMFHFEDDDLLSQFETILLKFRPKEVLFQNGNPTKRHIESSKRLGNNPLVTIIEENEESINSNLFSQQFNNTFPVWENGEWKCFSLVYSYFQMLLLDETLFPTMKIINQQSMTSSLDVSNHSSSSIKEASLSNSTLDVDESYKITNKLEISAPAISALELIGPKPSTLYSLFQPLMATPHGKRLIYRWITQPSAHHIPINNRLDAVEFLSSHKINVPPLPQSTFDLERGLSKIQRGSANLGFCHRFMDSVDSWIDFFHNFNSKISALQPPQLLKFINKSVLDLNFDFSKIKHLFGIENGKMEFSPRAELSPEFAQVQERSRTLEVESQKYIQKIKLETGCPNAKYRSSSKTSPWDIEFPAAWVSKNNHKLGSNWILSSSTKTAKRYSTSITVEFTYEMHDIEAENRILISQFSKQLNQHIDQFSLQLTTLIEMISYFDCIWSFVTVQTSIPNVTGWIRPEILPQNSDNPFTLYSNGINPCVANILSQQGKDFVSSSLSLGDKTSRCGLITGPNMGGKSTTLRTMCILVILSQMGCFVPCSSFKSTIVDALYTRIGANDKIFNNMSTFYVELAETSSILKNATPNSLVAFDELGRGTSTFDGQSLAYAVVQAVVERNCRVLFSTHYHSLCSDIICDLKWFSPQLNRSLVQLFHMACILDEKGKVIFLYSLVPGIADGSHGLQVAQLAGIPESLLTRAALASENLSNIHKSKSKSMNQFDSLVKRMFYCLKRTPAEQLVNLQQHWKTVGISPQRLS